MKALVIYDSFYGNTEKVAQAIGQALASRGEVQVLRVSDVTPEHLGGLDLLVVGSPTRAFRPSPATTRFLKGLPRDGLHGVRVAGFDTRISVADTKSGFLKVMVRLFGYAAEPISARLEKKGGTVAAPPAGFIVLGTEGPLKEGELDRASEWTAALQKSL